MNLSRISYRARQFWHSLTAAPVSHELEQARFMVSTELFDLFRSMPPGEQAHGLRVFAHLREYGQNNPHLLAAGLLHDVGKTCAPLYPWERAMIVLVQAFFPQQTLAWGQGEAVGWRRAFVTAAQHPQWGAELANRAGAHPLTVGLIRRHQEPANGDPQTMEDHLLQRLQEADNES